MNDLHLERTIKLYHRKTKEKVFGSGLTRREKVIEIYKKLNYNAYLRECIKRKIELPVELYIPGL